MKPELEKLLEYLETRVNPERALSGGIHSCGKIDHIVQEYLGLPSIHSLDLGQPEMNDLDTIYVNAKTRKIPLIRLDVPEEELLSGRVLERFPTGVTLKHSTSSIQAARRIMSAYRETSLTVNLVHHNRYYG